jgi:hypothetical protein
MSDTTNAAVLLREAILVLAEKQERETEELYRIYQALDRILQQLRRLEPGR